MAWDKGADMDRRRGEDSWMIDKKIPIAMIGAIVLQGAVFIWDASAVHSRIEVLEKSLDKSAAKGQHEDSEMASVKERILRLEINLANINSKLDEIKDLISKTVKK